MNVLELQELLKSLSVVGKSPLALIGYVVVVGAWVARGVLVLRPQMKAKEILALYEDESERNAALREITGNSVPAGLRRTDILAWVKIQATIQTRKLLLVAYVTTIVLVTTLVGIAVNHPVDSSTPILERETRTQ